MIADEVGVTKAAIYHQFKTKDELIIAAAAMELAKLEDALELAEAEDSRVRGREFLLERIVDHAVDHRRAATSMLFDPAIMRALSGNEQFSRWFERLCGLLVDDEQAPSAQVQLAALTSVIGGVVAHPLVADLDDDTLRRQLLHVVRGLTELPSAGQSGSRKRATA
jgi:AcrR family transcriptional regulator